MMRFPANMHGAKGYMLAIIASITYGLNPLFAVPLYGMGFDVVSVLFYRYLGAAIILGFVMALRGYTFRISRAIIFPLFGAGILFALSSYTLFESYRYMDVGIASTILYVTPIFVAIIMSTFFHQKIGVVGIVCVAIALLGIGLVSIKYDSTIQSPIGIIMVIVSSFVYSIYMILLKESSLSAMNSVSLTFYCILVGIIFFFIFLGFGQNLHPIIPSAAVLFNLGGLAVFPTIVSIVAMTVAIKIIGPVPTSILEALEPVTALVVGCVIFGERLTLLNMAGILIVLGSVTYFVIYRSKHNVQQSYS